MASQYCVKPHYTEQSCSLSSRFCKSTLHLGRVQWGQDEILYMGVIDREGSPSSAFLLLLSKLPNSSCWILLCHSKYFSSEGNVVYHLFHWFFPPCYTSGRQAFRPCGQCTFQWQEMVMHKSGSCHTVLNAGSTSCLCRRYPIIPAFSASHSTVEGCFSFHVLWCWIIKKKTKPKNLLNLYCTQFEHSDN